jgi:hypothetical protein
MKKKRLRQKVTGYACNEDRNYNKKTNHSVYSFNEEREKTHRKMLISNSALSLKVTVLLVKYANFRGLSIDTLTTYLPNFLCNFQ